MNVGVVKVSDTEVAIFHKENNFPTFSRMVLWGVSLFCLPLSAPEVHKYVSQDFAMKQSVCVCMHHRCKDIKCFT